MAMLHQTRTKGQPIVTIDITHILIVKVQINNARNTSPERLHRAPYQRHNTPSGVTKCVTYVLSGCVTHVLS